MAQGRPVQTKEDYEEEDSSILPELTRACTNVPIAADLEKITTINKAISRDPNAPSMPADQAGGDPLSPDSTDTSLPAPVYPTLSKATKIALPLLCMSGTFQQASSVVGVGLGIRLIGDELHIPEYQLQWLQSSVSLAYACTLLLFGRCADIWGHKMFFMSGLLMAGVFNLATGLAQTSMQIFVFRALTGAMFACVVPAAIGILATSFPPGPAKSRAFACFGAGAPIGNAVGLIIAGLTIEFAATGWRTFFYVSAGMTALTGILAYFLVPGPLLPNRKLKGQAVDIVGAFLAIAGLVLFVFALADGEGAPQGWKSSYIPTCLVIGAVLVGVFWMWERRLEKGGKQPPLMKVSVWKKGKFAILQLVTMCLFGSITAVIFWITLYWQNYEQLPVLEMTAKFVPLSITGVSVNFILALLVAHVPGHYLLLVTIVGSALSALLMAINDPSKTYWSYQFVSTCFTIWGADGIMLCGTLYVSRIVGPQDQAQGGSIFNTITQLSSSLVLALTTIVSDSVQNKEAARLGVIVHGNRDTTTVIPKEAILKGYQAAFWMCFAFMCFSGILTLVFLRDMGMVGAKKAKKAVGPEEEGVALDEVGKK